MTKTKPPEWPETTKELVENWQQRITDWHKFLISKHCSNYPTLESFKEYGELIEFEGSPRGADIFDGFDVDAGPLNLLFSLLDFGIYPPPELILTLEELWKIYLAHGGRITLEDVFIGKTKPKASNKAVEEEKEIRKMIMYQSYFNLLKKGKTQIEAAEIIKTEHRLKADSDSVVRMMHKYKKEGKYAFIVHTF